jgi:multicomponent K+:H+ antiporter subunit F
VLLGISVAVVMPLLMAPLRPRPGPLRRWGVLVRLILRVGRDVLLLGRAGRRRRCVRAVADPPRGTFVVVPLELRDVHALAALAMITAVVPGTVWSELAPDRSALAGPCLRPRRRGRIHPTLQDRLRTAAEGDLRMSDVLSLAITVTLILYAVAMGIGMARLFRGPSAQDRVLAMDFIYVVGMLVMLVLAIRYDSEMYFEGALLMVLFGFVGSVAMAKFLLRGEVI